MKLENRSQFLVSGWWIEGRDTGLREILLSLQLHSLVDGWESCEPHFRDSRLLVLDTTIVPS